ncbi:MAG: hypothetical protein AAGC74_14155 [Verrucomicrobiota bacterium]
MLFEGSEVAAGLAGTGFAIGAEAVAGASEESFEKLFATNDDVLSEVAEWDVDADEIYEKGLSRMARD